MNGNARLFHEFMEGQKVQLEIPVYQRNYNWQQENCEQLFKDLVKLAHSDAKNHFFGSIVSIHEDGGDNLIIIDGQQRITTISLLLLAAIRAAYDNKLVLEDSLLIDEAYELFLKAKSCQNHEHRDIKLAPIENDLIAYDKIFAYVQDNNISFNELDPESNMTRNFSYFYEKFVEQSKNSEAISFGDLLEAIERLLIIDISLNFDDDAQLIFESLNSTGLALTEADKIRNYLLMTLDPYEQQEYFENYWLKIEALTDHDPSKFLRPYLTIRQSLSRLENQKKIYILLKKDIEGQDRKLILQEMLKYATYYHQVNAAKFESKILSEKMSHIRNTKIDVAYVFFMQFLNYATEHKLSESEIGKVIDTIENFLARRLICGMDSNALTNIFCSLHKEVVKNIEQYKSAGRELKFGYSDILIYDLMRRGGRQILPRNEQFIESIKTRNIYNSSQEIKVFLFERLENSMPGEFNNVVLDMGTKAATIEHIMPQTLTPEWIAMLGENYEHIHEKYLHTFANLTLTGINSKLSNYSFEIKREGRIDSKGRKVPGYKDSKYRLTRSVMECTKWTEHELEQRANEIVNAFLELYPLPHTAFKPLLQSSYEIYLSDEDFDPATSKFVGFRLFGKNYNATDWNDLVIKVVKQMDYQYPDEMKAIYRGTDYFKTRVTLDELSVWNLVLPNRYMDSSMSAQEQLNMLRHIMERCSISDSDFVLLVDHQS